MGEIQKFTIILFKLPDGRAVLQRRTRDAPYAPGKLGIFGGWVEEDESTEECIVREIKEETSLDPKKLNIKAVTDFVLPAGSDFPKDRHFYLFTGDIDTLDFKVYEGDGAEAIELNSAAARNDLTGSARYVFLEILPKLHLT